VPFDDAVADTFEESAAFGDEAPFEDEMPFEDEVPFEAAATFGDVARFEVDFVLEAAGVVFDGVGDDSGVRVPRARVGVVIGGEDTPGPRTPGIAVRRCDLRHPAEPRPVVRRGRLGGERPVGSASLAGRRGRVSGPTMPPVTPD